LPEAGSVDRAGSGSWGASWVGDRLLRNTLAFWVVSAAIFVVAWSWRPVHRGDTPYPAHCRVRTAYPTPDGLLARAFHRVLLSNEDSWEAMRVGLDQALNRPHEPLYATVFDQCLKFQYPPSSLLSVDLLAKIAGPGALRNPVLNGISLLFLAVTLAVGWLLSRQALREHGAGPVGWALPVLYGILFYPALKSIEVGQIQTWLNSLMAIALLLYVRGHATSAGAVLGIVVSIKPQMALFLLFALVKRDWRLMKGLSVTAAAFGVLSLLRYGLAPHLEYLGVLRMIARHGESYFPNQSVNGLLLRALGLGGNLTFRLDQFAPYHPVVHGVTMAATFVMIGIGLYRLWIFRAERGLSFSLAVLCFTMASPVAWEHHYGILAPIFIVAFSELSGRPGALGRLWVPLAIAWLLTFARYAFTMMFADGPLNILQSHLYFGALVMVAVLYLLRQGHDESLAARPPVA